jgi:hypothetical protein
MTIMVDWVIQVEIARKPDDPELWIAFYPVDGEMRRTLFADLQHVKGAVEAESQMAHRRQTLEFRLPRGALRVAAVRSAVAAGGKSLRPESLPGALVTRPSPGCNRRSHR